MYLRTTQRRNTDGSVVRYVQVAHNRKVDGVTQAEVLLNLGREDRLDRDGLTRLVASINRYLGEPAPAALPGDAAQLVGDHCWVGRQAAGPSHAQLFGVQRGVGAVLNGISPSWPERATWTPTTALLAALAWRARRDG